MSDGPKPPSLTGKRPGPPAFLWWLLVLRAIVVLALGVAFLASGKVRPALGNILAVYWLVGALLTLRWVRANRGAHGSTLSSVAGVLGIAAAAMFLARHLLKTTISVGTMLAILGATSLITGALRLSGAFRDDLASDRPRLLPRIALGTVEIVLGVVFIAAREITRPVATAGGIWGLIGGTVMLLDALSIRRRTTSA